MAGYTSGRSKKKHHKRRPIPNNNSQPTSPTSSKSNSSRSSSEVGSEPPLHEYPAANVGEGQSSPASSLSNLTCRPSPGEISAKTSEYLTIESAGIESAGASGSTKRLRTDESQPINASERYAHSAKTQNDEDVGADDDLHSYVDSLEDEESSKSITSSEERFIREIHPMDSNARKPIDVSTLDEHDESINRFPSDSSHQRWVSPNSEVQDDLDARPRLTVDITAVNSKDSFSDVMYRAWSDRVKDVDAFIEATGVTPTDYDIDYPPINVPEDEPVWEDVDPVEEVAVEATQPAEMHLSTEQPVHDGAASHEVSADDSRSQADPNKFEIEERANETEEWTIAADDQSVKQIQEEITEESQSDDQSRKGAGGEHVQSEDEVALLAEPRAGESSAVSGREDANETVDTTDAWVREVLRSVKLPSIEAPVGTPHPTPNGYVVGKIDGEVSPMTMSVLIHGPPPYRPTTPSNLAGTAFLGRFEFESQDEPTQEEQLQGDTELNETKDSPESTKTGKLQTFKPFTDCPPFCPHRIHLLLMLYLAWRTFPFVFSPETGECKSSCQPGHYLARLLLPNMLLWPLYKAFHRPSVRQNAQAIHDWILDNQAYVLERYIFRLSYRISEMAGFDWWVWNLLVVVCLLVYDIYGNRILLLIPFLLFNQSTRNYLTTLKMGNTHIFDIKIANTYDNVFAFLQNIDASLPAHQDLRRQIHDVLVQLWTLYRRHYIFYTLCIIIMAHCYLQPPIRHALEADGIECFWFFGMFPTFCRSGQPGFYHRMHLATRNFVTPSLNLGSTTQALAGRNTSVGGSDRGAQMLDPDCNWFSWGMGVAPVCAERGIYGWPVDWIWYVLTRPAYAILVVLWKWSRERRIDVQRVRSGVASM